MHWIRFIPRYSSLSKGKPMALWIISTSCRPTSRKNGKYETTVYRKPTNTNLYVRWESAHPESQKLGTFYCLLQNYKRICSPEHFASEKQNLKEIFLANGYPEHRLEAVIRKFEAPRPTRDKQIRDSSIALSLPFVNGVSQKIGRAWKRIAKDYNISTDSTVVHRPVGKLKTSLCRPYKPDPPGQGVYQSICSLCDQTYIGETGLRLETRQLHHKRDKKSALSTHQHTFDCFDFELLHRSHDINERKILESFCIDEFSPVLNRTSGVERYVFSRWQYCFNYCYSCLNLFSLVLVGYDRLMMRPKGPRKLAIIVIKFSELLRQDTSIYMAFWNQQRIPLSREAYNVGTITLPILGVFHLNFHSRKVGSLIALPCVC